MAICPDGHQSRATDYCDECGLPIPAGAATGTPVPPPAPEAPRGNLCPNCQAANPTDALFCEACGYDFVTGTLPRGSLAELLRQPFEPSPDEPEAAPAPTPDDSEQGPADAEPQAQVPEDDHPDRPPEDAAAAEDEGEAADQAHDSGDGAEIDGGGTDSAGDGEHEPVEDRGADSAAGPDGGESAEGSAGLEAADSDDPDEQEVPPAEERDAPSDGSSHDPESQDEAPTPTDVEGAGDVPVDQHPDDEAEIPTSSRPAPQQKKRWVAETWIDPDWYRLQESPDPLPSPGLPEIFPLPDEGGLIGRVSRSQQIDPTVDCGHDTGCSRRHAQLSTDGVRWWIEDLGSANGTFVGETNGPLPTTPITVRTELTGDSRIYIGGWTRIVIRPATPDEDELF